MVSPKHLCFCFLVSIFFVHGQEIMSRKTKAVPFSIYEAESYDTDLSSLIRTNPSFTPFESFQKEFDYSKTYWLKVDMTQELDTLHTQKQWRLRTIWFDYAEMYTQTSYGIESTPIGLFNLDMQRTSLVHHPGVPFNASGLIDGYLYIKFRYFSVPFSYKSLKVQYLSETSNQLFTQYYTTEYMGTLFKFYVYAGICIITTICFLLIFGYTRKKEFLYYALYVFFCAVYLVARKIPIQEVMLSMHNHLMIGFILNGQIFINIFYCLFGVHYLDTQKNYPKFHKIIRGVIFTLILIVALNLVFRVLGLHHLHFVLFDFQNLFMTLFGVFSMIYLLIKSNDRLVHFIVLGSFLHMLGSLAFLFTGQSILMIMGNTLEIIIFTLGIAYKINTQYKEKLALKEEVSEKEISALRAQMNPHFIFNSLNSIQHLILSDDKMGALKYLTKFGKLARNVLENSAEAKVSLTDEINVLDSYLELESLRFDKAFSYTIDVDENLETDDIEVPLLLIQPFVENSIIHGLMPKKLGNKRLTIRFKPDGEDLICEVEDNGIGRVASQTMNNMVTCGKKSRGIKITERRLELITASETKNANINIQDKYDTEGNASGTKIIIKILAA